MGIKGRESREQAALLGAELEQGIYHIGLYEMVDMSWFQSLMKQKKLTLQDLEDPQKAQELLTETGNLNVIRVTINDFDFHQTIEDVKSGKDDKVFYRKKRTAYASLNVTFKVVEIPSGTIKAIEDASATVKMEATADKGIPPEFDARRMMKQVREKSVDRMVRLIAPRTAVSHKYFQRIKGNDDYKKGIKYAKIDDWDLAVPAFRSAYEKNTGDWKNIYNYGLALSCDEQYEKAVNILEKAFLIDDNNDVVRELRIAKERVEQPFPEELPKDPYAPDFDDEEEDSEDQ